MPPLDNVVVNLYRDDNDLFAYYWYVPNKPVERRGTGFSSVFTAALHATQSLREYEVSNPWPTK